MWWWGGETTGGERGCGLCQGIERLRVEEGRERRRSEEGVMGRDPGGRQQHLHTHRATVCVCEGRGVCERWGEGEGFPLHCCVTGNLIASSEGGSRGERKERRNAKSSEPELLLVGSVGGGGLLDPAAGW